VLSEKIILNKTKNHNPLQVKWPVPKHILFQPAKKNVSLPGICTGERELEGQLRMDNPLQHWTQDTG
jgi:hypothetical protein